MFVIMALVTTVMTSPLLRFWLPAEARSDAPGSSRRVGSAPIEAGATPQPAGAE
jgi:hypothetical protein